MCANATTCARMDCHDPYALRWELLGVFKDTVSFENDMFFEQRFKHQGYCLWDGDKEDDDDGGDDDGQDGEGQESESELGQSSNSQSYSN